MNVTLIPGQLRAEDLNDKRRHDLFGNYVIKDFPPWREPGQVQNCQFAIRVFPTHIEHRIAALLRISLPFR